MLNNLTSPLLGEQAILCSEAAMLQPPEHHAHETVLDRQSNELGHQLCSLAYGNRDDFNAKCVRFRAQDGAALSIQASK